MVIIRPPDPEPNPVAEECRLLAAASRRQWDLWPVRARDLLLRAAEEVERLSGYSVS